MAFNYTTNLRADGCRGCPLPDSGPVLTIRLFENQQHFPPRHSSGRPVGRKTAQNALFRRNVWRAAGSFIEYSLKKRPKLLKGF
jgi:hypothetical protein